MASIRFRHRFVRLIPARLVAGILLSCGILFGPGSANAEPSEQAPKRCVEVATRSRYVPYGYDHIVVLKNTCAKAKKCVVKTDATPKPQTVLVPGKKTKEVVTRRGSPARTFSPDVVCK